MTITRQQQFKSLLVDQLGQKDDGSIMTSLGAQDIKTLPDLMTLSDEDIKSLVVNDSNGNPVPLLKGDKGWLRSLKSFISHNQVAASELDKVTSDEFDEYRISTYNPDGPIVAASTYIPLRSSSGNKADHFKKSIKRDKSQYTALREDKQWDKWQRSTIATARSHNCEQIFDKGYVPQSIEDKETFIEKQKFMYAVFEEKLQTDMGKYYVRLHEHDFNAQTVFHKLSEYARTSTQASIDTADLLSYITSVKLHKSNWRGTSHAFILHWCDKVRMYEEMVPHSDHFTGNIKTIMLQNTVVGVSELHQVKTQSDHDRAHGGTTLSYDKYLNLLLSAASTYDSKRGLAKGRYTRTINHADVNGHDGLPDDNEFSFDEDSTFDIDTGFDNLFIYNTERRPFRPTMSKTKWLSLSKEEQELWDKFSSKSKAIILGIMQPSSMNDQVNVNQHILPSLGDNEHQSKEANDPSENSDDLEAEEPGTLFAHLTNQQGAYPGDLRRVLSQEATKPPLSKQSVSRSSASSSEIVLNGKKYRSVNTAKIEYNVSKHSGRTLARSLVDRGANGGLAGADVRIVEKHISPRLVDISGIDSHQVTDLPIVTVGGVVPSQRGSVIAILHQYAYLGQGKTIHSSGQLEHFKNDVNDRSLRVPGGLQRITTNDGYVHPLDISNGLAYIPIRPYTDEEWETLPHVVWTSDKDWDPSVLDHELSTNTDWFESISDLSEGVIHSVFDEFGEYKHRSAQLHVIDDGEKSLDAVVDYAIHVHNPDNTIFVNSHQFHSNISNISSGKQPDYVQLKPFFLYASPSTIKRTFDASTQYGRSAMGGVHLKKTYRSPFPALNVHRRNEAVATDTVFSDTPAVNNGATMAQIYVGRESLVTDVFGIKTEKQFVNTLLDEIRKRGAMDKLISDRAQVEVSKRALEILRSYCIDSWQSEPHYQHQNHAERRYAVIKPLVNLLLNTSGAPASAWLLAIQYVCHVLNHTATESIKWRTPLEKLNGSTPDISSIILFQFWEKIYYKHDNPSFPSDSTERLGRFVGIAEHVGHALTFKVLTEDTSKIIFRSRIRSAEESLVRNNRIDPSLSNQYDKVVRSKHDADIENGAPMPTIDPCDLVGRTFLQQPSEDGTRFRARIIEAIKEKDSECANDPQFVKFRCSVNDGEFEEIVTYNEIINHIEKDDVELGEWRFKSITAHEGPLSASDKSYRGSRYNVLVNWESGESTYEPLHIIAADDPVSCALYAKKNGLLDTEGWKRFKGIAKRQKKLNRLLNQAKLQSFNRCKVYKFGVEVPRNHDHAMELDRINGNTKWLDAEKLELSQVHEYNTFVDKGKDFRMAKEYTKIRVHMVYDVKHDGRHKARLVAGGHLTKTPVDSIYSGVVSLKGIRIILFLGELNGLESWATDIGNAYLEAMTKEKVYIVAGPEFGELEGHTLVINKALYGLRSSGLRWHEQLADTLRDMGFVPSKAEEDIWMRENNGVYEYIASYVDDLCVVAKDPKEITDDLVSKYKYKLKGTGPIEYHLGCNYFRDSEGVLCYAPKKYIEKLVLDFERMFGGKPKFYTSPLEKGDHPELDTSDELVEEDVKKYQSVIGSLQWTISLGRMDIATAVMTLSGFRACPRKGHLERSKRIVGYLAKMNQSTVRIRTEKPDYSDIPDRDYEWKHTVYGEVKELIPDDVPKPLGKDVVLTTYVDANLYHDILTGRSVTGTLHLINKTPFDWFSKKQGTVETATYGSEFVAARTAVEQIKANKLGLQYLGVPLIEKAYLFGDNKSVVDSSSVPHAKLHKRHTALSFHKVREMIASNTLVFSFIPGAINPADILSKHWGYQQVWPMLKTLLFREGNTGQDL